MKKSWLMQQLSESDEEEVFVVGEDGMEYDFTLEHADECFDGFYTVFPAHINLKAMEQKGDVWGNE